MRGSGEKVVPLQPLLRDKGMEFKLFTLNNGNKDQIAARRP
jgi:hypothetical protein